MSEDECEFISSRGLLKMCERYPKVLRSSNPVVGNYVVNENTLLKGTIYVCNSAIPEFVTKYLDNLKSEKVLVSGDSDDTMVMNEYASKIVNNVYIKHWYCQNWAGGVNEKITIMPIGLDYHTMSTQNMYWGQMTCPLKQENLLLEIRKSMRPLKDRQIKCYSNFHALMGNYNSYTYKQDRINAYTQVPAHLVHAEPSAMTRLNSWMNQSLFAFVLSPHGNGLDCHRTWEAMLLGCIPIVKSSPLDDLFTNLPVLIVKEWSDINEELLNNAIIWATHNDFDYEKLTLKYWLELMKQYLQN